MKRQWQTVLPWGIVAAGAGIRLWHLIANPSLYIDEARLALNIGTKSALQLLLPLDLEQIAPVPFLLLCKLAVDVFGMHPITLRLVSFACGLLLLPAMWRLSSKYLSWPAALVSLSLVAFSPAMVRASNEVKPYIVDALACVIVILMGHRLIERAGDRRSLVTAVMAAACLSLFSFTAVIVATGILSVGGVLAWRQRSRSSMLLLAGGGITIVLAALVPYVLIYQKVGSSDYMLAFWDRAFLTGIPSHDVLLLVDFVWGWFAGGMDPLTDRAIVRVLLRVTALATMLAALAGVWEIRRTRGRLRTVLLVVPVVAFGCLNALGMYPSALRLELFAVPIAAVLLGAALQATARVAANRRSLGRASAALLGMLLGGMLGTVLLPTFWPYSWQNVKEAIRRVPSSASVIYVNAGALPAWSFYTAHWSELDTMRMNWLFAAMRESGASFENASTLATPRMVGRLYRCEGDQLLLFGGRTGVQNRPYNDSRPPTNPGWASGEVDRLFATGAEDAWVILSSLRLADLSLERELKRRGAVVVRADTLMGAVALHVDLPEAGFDSGRAGMAEACGR